ncbi:MAG: DUF3578 domain-containing protein [Syntrophomonadaceae bacterium]|mgnify:CR=1 FL=1|nr:DUF3578 domain-containing protein [Syntrophomonadaceae bacterium]
MKETIRKFMLEIMSCYLGEKAMKYAKNPLARKIKSGFPRLFRETFFSGGLNYSVHGWAGWGNWTDNPYILIEHRLLRGKNGSALSIMYIFSGDMQYCYLALVVPWERMDTDRIFKEARSVRSKIRPRNSNIYSEYMDLRSKSETARRIEEACVFCRTYEVNNLPDEMSLQNDLREIISLYESYIRFRKFGRSAYKDKDKDDSEKRVFIKYRPGAENIPCHCEAVSADSDNYTGEIVDSIGKRTGCSVIINTAPSAQYDLNRHTNPRNVEAVYEYRDTLHRILKYKEALDSDGKVVVPFLHLAFHAIKKGDTHGSEIRVSYTEPASYSMINWFANRLKDKTRKFSVHGSLPVRIHVQIIDKQTSLSRRYWESCHSFNGENKAYHFIVVEISEDLRSMGREALVGAFSETVLDFSIEFGETGPGIRLKRQIC